MASKSIYFNLFCLTPEYTKLLVSQIENYGVDVYPGLINKKYSMSNGIVTYTSLRLKSNLLDSWEMPLIANLIKDILSHCKVYYYGFTLIKKSDASFYSVMGNINGETDISRLFKMKALW